MCPTLISRRAIFPKKKPVPHNDPAAAHATKPSGREMRAGYTSATVAFIDNDHVLLTYSARKLLKRSPDQREGDDDHAVRAEVVHLPDGKVVRETEWRMHDRAPYLWVLGSGRFLLRER